MKDFYEYKKSAPYPFNLILALNESALPDELEIGLKGLRQMMQNVLSEREQSIIKKRWDENLTLETTAKSFEITRERARQIEAVSLMRLQKNAKAYASIRYSEYCSLQAQNASYKANLDSANARIEEYCKISGRLREVQTDTVWLEDLDLSVRSYNVLRRHGCKTVVDVTKIPMGTFYGLRNLGRKSADEIIRTIHSRDLLMSWEKN